MRTRPCSSRANDTARAAGQMGTLSSGSHQTTRQKRPANFVTEDKPHYAANDLQLR